MRFSLLSILAFIALTGMTCSTLPIDSTEDSIGAFYKSVETVARSARELCGTSSPEPCTGVLPTQTRDTIKRSLQEALDAAREADEALLRGEPTQDALGRAEAILMGAKTQLGRFQ